MDAFVLSGRREILQNAHLLEHLAERCGQRGSMHWLGYFLGSRSRLWKRYHVVLLLKAGADRRELRQEDLIAAVLVYELCPLGIRTRAVATDDWEGFRTVVAPPELRRQAALAASEALMKRGAHIVLISYQHDASTGFPARSEGAAETHGSYRVECRRGLSQSCLVLGNTFEATLQKFGHATRANMRYYRKRLSLTMPYQFIPDALKLLREQDLALIAARSINPLSTSELRRRFHAARDLPGGFLIGLRGPHGWLSLLGGWRHATTTVMYFQVNCSGHEKCSLGTVMRSHFLESEVARGTQTLVFYHGTNHTMSHAFEAQTVCDLLMQRPSLQAAVLRKTAGLLAEPDAYANKRYYGGSNSFLAIALASRPTAWQIAEGASASAPFLADC